VKYLVNYAPPIPTVAVNHGSAAYANEQLCDNEEITLIPTSSVDIYKSQLQYQWEYNVNGETYTNWYPNPAYCGDVPGNCDGTGGAIQSLGSPYLNANGKIVPLVGVPIGTPTTPPCCFEPPALSEELTLWRSLGSSTGNDTNGGNFSFQVSKVLASVSQIPPYI